MGSQRMTMPMMGARRARIMLMIIEKKTENIPLDISNCNGANRQDKEKRKYDNDDIHFIEDEPEHRPGNNCG